VSADGSSTRNSTRLFSPTVRDRESPALLALARRRHDAWSRGADRERTDGGPKGALSAVTNPSTRSRRSQSPDERHQSLPCAHTPSFHGRWRRGIAERDSLGPSEGGDLVSRPRSCPNDFIASDPIVRPTWQAPTADRWKERYGPVEAKGPVVATQGRYDLLLASRRTQVGRRPVVQRHVEHARLELPRDELHELVAKRKGGPHAAAWLARLFVSRM